MKGKEASEWCVGKWVCIVDNWSLTFLGSWGAPGQTCTSASPHLVQEEAGCLSHSVHPSLVKGCSWARWEDELPAHPVCMERVSVEGGVASGRSYSSLQWFPQFQLFTVIQSY